MQLHSDPNTQPSSQVSPASYHELHWASVNRVKEYLYRRLAPMLDDALERMEAVERGDGGRGRTALAPVAQRLEMARNTLAAWEALITVESGGLAPGSKRLPLAASMLPAWLTDAIRSRTTLTLDYKRPVFVHPEVFYESLLLLSQIGDEIGALLQITLADAPEAQRGVWLRAVFVPPVRGAYSGMSTLLNALRARGDAGDAVFCLHVASSLLKINDSRLVLQNNRKSGEQALAALLPTLTANDLRQAHSDARRAPLRLVEREQSAPPSGPTGSLKPFRLDDSDLQPSEGPVPVFPPGALETWLGEGKNAPQPADSAAPSAPALLQPPEA